MDNTLTLDVDGITHILQKGTCVKDIADKIVNVTFSCLRGRCGSCLVKKLKGNLGEVTGSELLFLELTDLNPSDHRLLCQTVIKTDSTIEKY